MSAIRPTTAADVMTSPVVQVGPEASVAEAARVMRTRSVGWLAVVDDSGGRGRLVGVLGRADVLSVFLRGDADLRHEILHGVFGTFLGVDPATMEIDVRDGVATLNGELALRSDAELAVALVGRLEGVVAVVDRLTYRSIESRRDAVATPLF
ncbi:CBS domain-containing protein [Pseudonocardia sp. N23]|uniref:CBS domain-containing protein n=1 Tax=Pseudonocardia sp. N23 TaxID=1987376 RepID=UPI00209BE56F|nr:CBS domain-containing protein [Pseudonocardia sp. N23]